MRSTASNFLLFFISNNKAKSKLKRFSQKKRIFLNLNTVPISNKKQKT
jgi:hypothetical protein